jgi:uncharacterized membrane protein (Fun14 family)
MDVYNFGSIASTIGGGFFIGALIGFALKKVLKILAILVGLFFAGLAYLQYQQIVNINWDKLQATSQNAVTTLTNATTQISNQIGNVTHSNNHSTAALAISNFAVQLTGSIAMGFAVGFMKG